MLRGGPAVALGALACLAALPGCSLILDFSGPLNDAAPVDADRSDAADSCPVNEPNDDLATATPIEAGVIDASICPLGDRDFYRFTVDGTADVVAILSFAGLSGAEDLDLTLHDVATAMPVTIATGIGDEARIEHSMALGNVLVAGDYVLEVVGKDDQVKNSYQLTLTVGTTPPPDAAPL